MNCKINRTLFQCLRTEHPYEAMGAEATDMVDAHNSAVHYGLIDMPMLSYGGVSHCDNKIMLSIKPKAGIININDLYNLKTLWGADDLNVDADGIEMVFKK